MKLEFSEKKLRDRVIFAYGVIPTKVDVKRHEVEVELKAKDVERLALDTEAVAEDLKTLVDREVHVTSV